MGCVSGFAPVDEVENALQVTHRLTHGLVSRLEDGTGNPSLKTLAAIAKALNVTISELLSGV